MDEPPIELPTSAYLMAAISGVFVFCGAGFVLGILAVMVVHGLMGLPEWSLILVAPFVVMISALLGYLSAWETLQQARTKAQLARQAQIPEVTCDGCGEDYSADAPHCPVCGRETVVLTIQPN